MIAYSMIVVTKRDTKALKPLFVNTYSDTELIVIDSNYNNKTKKYLKSQVGKYEKIVYAPVKKKVLNFKRDFSQALNTALLYAEGEWIIRADDNLELHPDFFSRIEEDINYFGREISNNRFAIIGRKLWETLGEQKWHDNPRFPNRYSKVTNPNFTFSFGIYPREVLNTLNGYDELYDLGWQKEDEDFLLRLMVLGFQVFFDKELLGFSSTHSQGRYDLDFTDKLYEIQSIGIKCGKLRAYNPFNYETDNRNCIKNEKEKYIIR